MNIASNIIEIFKNSRGFEPRRIRAQKLGISKSLLDKIETGKVTPSLKVLIKQAALDGKPLDFYFAHSDHVS
ncbi:MAG: helix-turn-helix transcriptional regulator [Negativicutes bacterium]|nr:helix-turn-helix transcriptional regulator [Negativicutes bacterium]